MDIPPTPQQPAPVAALPPTLADITNIVMHRERALKRKREDPIAVPDQVISNIVIQEHLVSNPHSFLTVFTS